MCDDHPDRPAVARIQGETDSFGAEYSDLCQECLDEHRAYQADPANNLGTCEWCKTSNVRVRPHRDFEEGSAGRVYDVCGACIQRENERLAEEDDYDDEPCWDDYDDEPEHDCGEDVCVCADPA